MKKTTRAKKPTAKVNKPTAAKTRKRPTRIPVRGSARKPAKPERAVAGVARRPESTAKGREGAAAAAAHRDLPEVRALAVEAMEAALDKKALMPILIDVSGMASYTDFIGIVSGRSDRQVDAIAENVAAVMKSRGRRILGQEGSGSGRWALLDFGSIVIHVFYHPVREFYDLESLWIDAPRVKFDIPPDAMISQPDALYEAL